MSIENLQLFLPFLAPILGLLGATLLFLEKFVKNKKLKNVLEKAEEVTKNIIPYIMEAEKFINYTGEEKKKYVMTRLNQYAIENNIKFNQIEMSNKIEELVELTKNVNIKSYPITIDEEVIDKTIKNENIEKQIQNIIDRLAR